MQNSQDPELREKIVELRKQGKSCQEIADTFAVHYNTVFRYLRRAGLTKTRVPKDRVVKLLMVRPRLTYKKIGEMVGLCKGRIREIAHANGLGRRTGIPENVRVELVQDILAHRDYAAALARKYRVPYKRVLELAKEVLHCSELVSGTPKTPLISYGPQLNPDSFSIAKPDVFVRLVGDLFPSGLPKLPDEAVAVTLTRLFFFHCPEWQHATVKQLGELDLQLLMALKTIRATQMATAWLN